MTAKTDATTEEAETTAQDTPLTAGARLAARKAAKAAKKASERGKGQDAALAAVQQQAAEAGNWLAENGRVIALASMGVLVAAAAYVGIQYTQRQTRGVAASGLEVAVKAALAAVGGDDEADATTDDEVFPTAEARSVKAQAGYQSVIRDHAGSDAALWAQLGVGAELLGQGKAAEAHAAYAAALAAADDSFVRYRALEGQGYALEAQDKLDEANQKYAEIGKLEGGAYKPVSDYHIARLLAVRGDEASAKEMLAKLVEALNAQALDKGTRFPALRDEAQLRLLALGGERTARPSASGPAVGSEGLTPEILEALRQQLETKGGSAP